MSLIQRAQDILLKPKETWPLIAGEGGDTASIYSNYVVYLAAIPAIAFLIGFVVIGAGAFGIGVRMPLMAGLVQMVVSYVLSLAMVFVLALIIDALAPTFNGTKSQFSALKVAAYGSTAYFVGGIFSLIPALSILGLLVGLYSIYLIYTGLPVLMKCPTEKAAAYTAVVVVCGIVAAVILGAVLAVFTPGAAMRFGAGPSYGTAENVTVATPGGDIKIDTAKMDALAKKMDAAAKSGDANAAGKAAGAMISAIGGANAAPPIPAPDLRALLPASLGELQRESIESGGAEAGGLGGTSAKAVYAAGDKRVQLAVTDLGGLAGVASMAAWANIQNDRETSTEREKTYKAGNRTVHEKQQKDGSRGEYTVLLVNGVVVEASGEQVDVAALKSAVDGLQLARLEAMKPAPTATK